MLIIETHRTKWLHGHTRKTWQMYLAMDSINVQSPKGSVLKPRAPRRAEPSYGLAYNCIEEYKYAWTTEILAHMSKKATTRTRSMKTDYVSDDHLWRFSMWRIVNPENSCFKFYRCRSKHCQAGRRGDKHRRKSDAKRWFVAWRLRCRSAELGRGEGRVGGGKCTLYGPV